VPAQIFATGDGYLTLFITHDTFWSKFCKAAGKIEWTTDPAYATMAARSANRDTVLEGVSNMMLTRTTARWLALLQPLGIVIAGVRSLEDAMQCEHTLARDMVVEIATPEGILRLMGNPIKGDSGGSSMSAPPLLGEHNCTESTPAATAT